MIHANEAKQASDVARENAGARVPQLEAHLDRKIREASQQGLKKVSYEFGGVGFPILPAADAALRAKLKENGYRFTEEKNEIYPTIEWD